MKVVSLLVAAIVLLASSAFAYDHTMIRSVPANDWRLVPVHLPAGVSDVQVETNGDKLISCTFFRAPNHEAGDTKSWVDLSSKEDVVFEAKNTNVCLGRANLIVPEIIFVKVDSKNNENLLFKVWVHDPASLHHYTWRN